ncbi:MAG: hypothetical protein C5S41_05400 [Candidatus Methanomarinus sp.]|jgi:hypothetical protein|nr:MAG: hypothetical protein C5S41_05400 [ANME-2 cluster archaeon]KAF5426435.1 hypothetical protein C5S42_07600 [ANME-2 cluster archaeon]
MTGITGGLFAGPGSTIIFVILLTIDTIDFIAKVLLGDILVVYNL